MKSKKGLENTKDFLKYEAEIEKVCSSKKPLREILTLHLKNKKTFEKFSKEKISIEDENKKMCEANNSFNSIMDIYKILVGVYKKLVKLSSKNNHK